MRIAWITPYFPVPENTGGRIRIARMAHGFDAEDQVDLYSRISAHDTLPAGGVAPFGPWHAVFAHTGHDHKRLLELRPHAARIMPAELEQDLLREDARAPYDAVVIEHCYAAEIAPRLARAVLIVDEHNVESDYYRGLFTARSRMLHNGLEYYKWRRYERAVWRRADQVIAVSAADAAAVGRVQPGKGVVVPNGTALDSFRFILPSARQGSSILYVGMMSYGPNIAAVTVLAREVLPALRERVPDATLTIAGRDPTPEVRALESSSVRVTGTVPDVASLFDEHAAYAMPLTQGAGSSLKALEPLAAGLPLVASPFAVRGYELPRDAFVNAETVPEFVRGLERVLRERGQLDEMAKRARAAVERYAWPVLAKQFATAVRAAVLARRESPGLADRAQLSSA